MNSWVECLNAVTLQWQNGMVRASWQGGLALLLAWAISRSLSRLPAAAKVWFWRLAFSKCLVAFFWATPIDLPLLKAPAAVSRTELKTPLTFNPRIRSAPDTVANATTSRAKITPTTWLFGFWCFGIICCGGRL